jgi:hypothetical protein
VKTVVRTTSKVEEAALCYLLIYPKFSGKVRGKQENGLQNGRFPGGGSNQVPMRRKPNALQQSF